MKKILLIFLINISFLVSEDSFISICKNPTPSQIVTLKAMLKIVNDYKINQPKIKFNNPHICEILNEGFVVVPYLQNLNITDISILKYFPNTPTLNLWNNKITDITPLKYLIKLTKLNLGANTNLKSLECIDQFPNLKKLRIARSPIIDLTPLVNANSIEEFHIYDMPVSDLTPLTKMKNLRSILFSKTKIKYLSPLKESKSIQFAEDTREKFIEEYFNRSLAGCSPKSMKEVREGKSCFEADGKTLKPFWKRWLGL